MHPDDKRPTLDHGLGEVLRITGRNGIAIHDSAAGTGFITTAAFQSRQPIEDPTASIRSTNGNVAFKVTGDPSRQFAPAFPEHVFHIV